MHEISSLFVVVHRSISTDSTLVAYDNGSFSVFFGKKFSRTKPKAFFTGMQMLQKLTDSL